MKGVKGYNAMYVFYGHTTRCNETVLYRNDQNAKIIYCTLTIILRYTKIGWYRLKNKWWIIFNISDSPECVIEQSEDDGNIILECIADANPNDVTVSFSFSTTLKPNNTDLQILPHFISFVVSLDTWQLYFWRGGCFFGWNEKLHKRQCLERKFRNLYLLRTEHNGRRNTLWDWSYR